MDAGNPRLIDYPAVRRLNCLAAQCTFADMAREPIPINGAIVAWARERSGYSLAELQANFRAIEEWERGSSAPTYPQLEALADKLKLPIAVFFFPEPPKMPPLRESFRTLPDAEFEQMPPRVRLMLRKAQAMQMNLAELSGGKNPAPRMAIRDLSFDSNVSLPSMAAHVRGYFNISFETQVQWPDEDHALESWRDALVSAGVFVFKDAFKSEEYSGFCLYDPEFPIIYVNNSMSKTRQIFTLFHELAHLVFHTSGIDTPSLEWVDRLPNDAQRIEVQANKFAGEFLVPNAEFSRRTAGVEVNRETAALLARRFKVSRDVIYRKFLDRRAISQSEYESAVADWSAQARAAAASRGEGGGNYYNTQIAYLGKEYLRLCFSQYYQNRIDETQLADYLNVAPKNLSGIEARLPWGGP